jgi:hypothetical protein
LAEGYRDPNVGLGSTVDVLESLESTYPRHIINIPRECSNCMIQSVPMSRAQRDAMSFHQTLAPPRPLVSTDWTCRVFWINYLTKTRGEFVATLIVLCEPPTSSVPITYAAAILNMASSTDVDTSNNDRVPLVNLERYKLSLSIPCASTELSIVLGVV